MAPPSKQFATPSLAARRKSRRRFWARSSTRCLQPRELANETAGRQRCPPSARRGMSHTNLSAAEIALLDSQLPDIGGTVRNEPITLDGDGWRVGAGSSTK